MSKKIGTISIAVVIFALFLYICSSTPLAGDDWGYAINGLKGNPFMTAIDFYVSWSGRFFSELYGFLVAPHKMLWNILNPLLFTGIFIMIMKIINSKKNELLVGLTILLLILSVKDFVRMETYTWIMGTTYVIPLFLSLVIVYCYKRMIIDNYYSRKYYYLIGISSFVACLMMENISAVILVLNLSALVYQYFFNHKQYHQCIAYTLISIVSFIILRSSPGANYRLLNEHQAFVSLNLFEKIMTNWPNFIRFTFLDNKYMIMILSLVLITFTIFKIKDKRISIPLSIIFSLGFFQSVSSILFSITHLEFLRFFFDQSLSQTTIICTLLYVLYVISVFVLLLLQPKDDLKIIGITVLVMAGLSNGAMLLSPIFGSRSSLYTIYFIILFVGLLLNEVNIDTIYRIIVIILLILLNLLFVKKYYDKYTLVRSVQNERLSQIEYYQDHPEVEEAWIVRMPIYSIHSADVEEWDTYHMDTFKEYYGLNPNMKIIFYYKEGY